jgi:glycosyltransferase involved in cell wall biosynthesis
MTQISVDLVCDILSPSGYSAHARELVKALDPVVDLRIVDRKHDRQTVSVDYEQGQLYKRLMAKARVPKVRIQFETPEFFQPSASVFNIGFTQWETTRIPDTDLGGEERMNWVKQMNRMNAMWTSCSMAAKAFKDSGVTVPVSVFSGPVDPEFYRPRLPELDLQDIVISREGAVIPRDQRPPVVGMMAQWTKRKNIEGFLVTMLSRFQRDEVAVVLKTYGSSMDASQGKMVRERVDMLVKSVGNPNPPKILVLTEQLSEEEIASFFSSIDIYVNTSRGEGFCMPLVQAMASECFPISNGFSAPADYLRGAMVYTMKHEPLADRRMNGIPIPYTLAPVFGMNYVPWYRYDQSWGEIGLDSLADAVRLAVRWRKEKPESYRAVCQNARQTVIDRMSPKAIGEAMLKEIEALCLTTSN